MLQRNAQGELYLSTNWLEIADWCSYGILFITFSYLNGILGVLLHITFGIVSPIYLVFGSISAVVYVSKGYHPFRTILSSSYLLFFGTYLLVATFASLICIEPSFNYGMAGYLDKFRDLLATLLIYISLYGFFCKCTEQQFRTILVILAITLILTNIPTYFIVSVNGDSGNEVVDYRKTGIYGQPNVAGYVAMISAAFAVFMTFYRTEWWRWFFALGFFLSIGAGLVTVSKAAMVMAVGIIGFTILYLFAFFYKFRAKQRTVASVILGIITIISLTVIPYLYSNYKTIFSYNVIRRVEQVGEIIFEGKFDRKTTSTRSDNFEKLIIELPKSPVIGFGLGAVTCRLPWGYHGIHNTYFQIVGESGAIGMIPFIIFISLLAFGIFDHYDNAERLFFALFLIVTLIAFSTTHTILSNKIYTAILAIMCARVKIRPMPMIGLGSK